MPIQLPRSNKVVPAPRLAVSAVSAFSFLLFLVSILLVTTLGFSAPMLVLN